MKKIYTLLFLFIQITTAFSQNIKGTINDPATQQPLVGVSVAVKGKVIGTVTNAKGQLELNTTLPATLVEIGRAHV